MPVPRLLIAACGVAAVAISLVAFTSTVTRKRVPLMLLAGVSTVAGLIVADPWMRLGLLELGALVTVVLVWQTARTHAAKLTYLAVVLISAATMVASELAGNAQNQAWPRALLLTGICVKLAAVPVFFWLLSLADELPAMVLGLIIGVIDMAAFGEFCVGAASINSAIFPGTLWIWAAALTALVAAMLMLSQRSLKRLLVLSTIEDAGFLLLGLGSATVLGLNGALIAAASHALAKALLFTCLSAPEADGELSAEPVGLAARYPVSAFGFLFGMLAMLGVPPTLGFIGRWRLYSAALQIGPWPLAIFILSSIFALIAYVLALTRNWWGPPPETGPPRGKETFALRATIVALVALLLAAGMWPNAWQMLMGVAR
jgi:formate hydrogenlyase subunit 3/multisubunit Na+/H+ antiporter MnhD subunit